MFRIDNDTASAALAPATAAGAPGYFSDGNPGAAVPPTTVPSEWFNMIQEELMAVLAAAGIDPDKADRGQVAAAILALIAGTQAVTWQDVTGARASGVNYTNDTGHAIEVIIVFPDTNGATAYATITVDGVNIVNHVEYDHDTSTGAFCASFKVPAGKDYSATASGGTIASWCELR